VHQRKRRPKQKRKRPRISKKAKEKKKAEAAAKKKARFAQVDEESDSETSLQFTTTDTTKGGLKLRDVILLDNQSTPDLFCNKKFVTNIHKVKGQMTVQSNGSELTTNLKAHVKGHGLVWFSEDALINIASMKNVASKHLITYNHQEGKTTGSLLVAAVGFACWEAMVPSATRIGGLTARAWNKNVPQISWIRFVSALVNGLDMSVSSAYWMVVPYLGGSH
jgi:hypothetical protein